MARRGHFLKRLFFSKFFVIVNLIILILIGVVLGKRIFERRGVNQEIAVLEEEIGRLEGDNDELTELIEYLNTNSYIEEEARLKLGLKKPGESVVVVPEGLLSEEMTQEGNGVAEKTNQVETNLSKWWNYFFGK